MAAQFRGEDATARSMWEAFTPTVLQEDLAVALMDRRSFATTVDHHCSRFGVTRLGLAEAGMRAALADRRDCLPIRIAEVRRHVLKDDAQFLRLLRELDVGDDREIDRLLACAGVSAADRMNLFGITRSPWSSGSNSND